MDLKEVKEVADYLIFIIIITVQEDLVNFSIITFVQNLVNLNSY